MEKYEALLARFVDGCRELLGENLVGVYLHGSATMGCFNPKCSDLDLIVVVCDAPSDADKRRFMARVVALNADAPAKGLEMSVVRASVCRPFVYPTPFELHFSSAHLDGYLRDPADYVARMKGTDIDLAAHFTVLRHRGRALSGPPIAEVFGEVPAEDYFDSILGDIREAEADILRQPVYVTLNLCRTLAFREEGSVLSKREGGEWALRKLPEALLPPVRDALSAYAAGAPMAAEPESARAFARELLRRIGVGAQCN